MIGHDHEQFLSLLVLQRHHSDRMAETQNETKNETETSISWILFSLTENKPINVRLMTWLLFNVIWHIPGKSCLILTQAESKYNFVINDLLL